jgi:FkbM family methyltransferase
MFVLWEVFVAEAYPRRHLPESARTVVDLGANAGVTVRYFAQLYPGARIIGYEPDPTTFETCRRNVRGLPNVEVRNAAVGTEDGPILLRRARGASWATSAYGEGDGEAFTAPQVRLDQIIEELGVVELLKLDIEGAEWPVLRASRRLSEVRHIVGEFHREAGVPVEEFLGAFADDFDVVWDDVDRDLLRGEFALRSRRA